MHKEVNWLASEWFAKHHARDLADEFKAWWIEFYGTPDEYSIDSAEQSQYWIRCAFAWHGWRAASGRPKSKE